MPHLFKTAALLLFAMTCLSCQSPARSAPKESSVSLSDLGFRYTPPAGMEDLTSPADKEARNHAASRTTNKLALLIDLRGGGNDTAPDWHQLWVFTYPRALWPKLTDSAAAEKINTAIAAPRAAAVGKPQSALLAGHTFVVSEFEQKEPPLLKHARIFTTICNGQLVSFALVSNSADQVKTMEESLKTLDFSAH